MKPAKIDQPKFTSLLSKNPLTIRNPLSTSP